jgi:hypothetical protein
MPNEAAAQRSYVSDEVHQDKSETGAVEEIARIPILIHGKTHLIGDFFDVTLKDDGDILIFGKKEKLDKVSATVLVLTIQGGTKRKILVGGSKRKDGTYFVIVREV